MSIFDDIFGGDNASDFFKNIFGGSDDNSALPGLGGGAGDFLSQLAGLGAEFDPFGNPIGDFANFDPSDLFFDNQTGKLVSFSQIIQDDPTAAYRLDPQKFFTTISSRNNNLGFGDTTKLGPQNQSFGDKLTDIFSGDQGGKTYGNLAKLAPLLSTAGGIGLASAGFLSGGGSVADPKTDPRAQALIDLITKQAQLQSKLTSDTLKSSQFGDESKLRDLGLQGLIDQIQDPNFVQKLYSSDNEVRLAANKELLGVLNQGPGEASPELLRQLEEQKRALDEDYLSRLGPGYATSTPYQTAKSDFDKRSLEATADDALFRRAQKISLLSGVALPRSQFLADTNNQNFARNTAAASSSPSSEALSKILSSINQGLPAAQLGLNAYQNQANNLLSANMFNLGEANKNRSSLLTGGGQLIGLGLYGLGRGNRSSIYG